MASKRSPKSVNPPKVAMTTARAEISAKEIRQLIAQAAYYNAEARGFAPGHELDDWVAAEAEVRRTLDG